MPEGPSIVFLKELVQHFAGQKILRQNKTENFFLYKLPGAV
jgi:hypothetical protein